MNRIATTAAALLVLTGAAGSAAAQPHRDNGRQEQRYDRQGNGRHDNGRHLGWQKQQHKQWRKGGHIERSDWNRGARIDYRRHHLNAPPRGYEWRQVDNSYVLAAVATGLIASILLAQ